MRWPLSTAVENVQKSVNLCVEKKHNGKLNTGVWVKQASYSPPKTAENVQNSSS